MWTFLNFTVDVFISCKMTSDLIENSHKNLTISWTVLTHLEIHLPLDHGQVMMRAKQAQIMMFLQHALGKKKKINSQCSILCSSSQIILSYFHHSTKHFLSPQVMVFQRKTVLLSTIQTMTRTIAMMAPTWRSLRYELFILSLKSTVWYRMLMTFIAMKRMWMHQCFYLIQH